MVYIDPGAETRQRDTRTSSVPLGVSLMNRTLCSGPCVNPGIYFAARELSGLYLNGPGWFLLGQRLLTEPFCKAHVYPGVLPPSWRVSGPTGSYPYPFAALKCATLPL